jgi:hypothetical protein
MVKDEELIKEIEEKGIILIAENGFLDVVFNEGRRNIYFKFNNERKIFECTYNYIDGIKEVDLFKNLKSLLNGNAFSFFNFEDLMISDVLTGGFFNAKFKYLFIDYDFRRLYVVIK